MMPTTVKITYLYHRICLHPMHHRMHFPANSWEKFYANNSKGRRSTQYREGFTWFRYCRIMSLVHVSLSFKLTKPVCNCSCEDSSVVQRNCLKTLSNGIYRRVYISHLPSRFLIAQQNKFQHKWRIKRRHLVREQSLTMPLFWLPCYFPIFYQK